MRKILKINNMTMRFGGVVAVSQLSMEIERANCRPNRPQWGRKTTVFNVVTESQPTDGEVYYGKP